MKKCIIFFLCLSLMLSIMPFSAFANEEDGYKYIVLEDGTIRITHCAFNNAETLVIPSTIDGRTVSAIYPNEWYTVIGNWVNLFGSQGNNKVKKIILPDSLKELGNCTFAGCTQLSEIVLPESLTTLSGNDIFAFCNKLDRIVIPSSVNYVSPSALFYNDNLTISVNSDNPVYDSRDNCNAVIETATNTLVASCTNTTIPDSVTTIGECAFSSYTTSDNHIIPANVTSIEYQAFWFAEAITIMNPNCKLDTVIGYGGKIYGYEGSTAQKYVQDNPDYDLTFIALVDTPTTTPTTPPTTPPTTAPTTPPTTTPTTPPTTDTVIIGDVDSDGEVSVMDATTIQMHMASLKKLTDEQKAVADTDKDGEVSVMDATAIQLFVAKIIPEL